MEDKRDNLELNDQLSDRIENDKNKDLQITPLFDEEGNMVDDPDLKTKPTSDLTSTPIKPTEPGSPKPAEIETPEPAEIETPEPAEIETPEPAEIETPEPAESEIPESTVLAKIEVVNTDAVIEPDPTEEAAVAEEIETETEKESSDRIVSEEETAMVESEPIAEPAAVVEDIETETAMDSSDEIVSEEEKAGDEPEPLIAAAEESSEKTEQDVEDEEANEDDDSQDEEIEDHADYSSLSKEEIVIATEELVAQENVMQFRQKAGKLMIAYHAIFKGERDKALEDFVSEGGDRDAFENLQDELDVRYDAAMILYKEKKQQYLSQLEEIKKENLARKLEMLEQIKELINSEEPLKKTYDEFRGIQDRWREIGNVPKSEISNLWQSYHFLVEKFFDKVKINNELRDLDMKKNLEKKIELCEKAEELLLETSVLKSFKQLQRYHQEWKEIGSVPPDKKDELWERFRSATEKINERRREYYEQLHQEQENNYSAKKALCEKAEELLSTLPESISGWQKTTDEINELMKMWRSLGPAPRQHNDEVWKRFKTSIDEFYNQKKIHFNAVKDEQINNYNMKLDICQQAEAIKESTDWRETTEELIMLQQEWKKIGPVPRRHADKIWKRFRSACDEFFSRKQSHFSSQKESEEENLKVKEALIEKINSLQINDNREQALNTIKQIQREFIDTGHVPFRKKNDIHKAFRDAISQKLDQLKISPAEISAMQFRARSESSGDRTRPTGDRQGSRERTFLNSKISKLKSDIALWENNIGFLANSAAAEVLKSEFEKKIERTKDEIVLLETKLKMMQD